jgi:hypothetical protein
MATTEDIEKIKLLDQVFRSVSVDDIKSIFSADLIVDKLKSTEIITGPILSAIQDISMIRLEIATLRADHTMLKEDFRTALRAIQALSMPPVVPYSSDLQTLKSKYNVY